MTRVVWDEEKCQHSLLVRTPEKEFLKLLRRRTLSADLGPFGHNTLNRICKKRQSHQSTLYFVDLPFATFLVLPITFFFITSLSNDMNRRGQVVLEICLRQHRIV